MSARVDELYKKRAGLVNNNAEWNKYNLLIKTASDDYRASLEKLSQADVIKQSGGEESPMKVLEYPMFPYRAESNKRALLSSFAGVGAGTLTMVFMFLLTYFDRSLGSVFQYEKQVGLPLFISNKLLKS